MKRYCISFFFPLLSIKQDLCLISLLCNYPLGFISDSSRKQYTSRTSWLLRRVIAAPPDCLTSPTPFTARSTLLKQKRVSTVNFVPFQEGA